MLIDSSWWFGRLWYGPNMKIKNWLLKHVEACVSFVLRSAFFLSRAGVAMSSACARPVMDQFDTSPTKSIDWNQEYSEIILLV